MKLSLCITTYNRYEMTIESFAKVIDDPRIDDIVIMDDCSTDGSAEKLAEYFSKNKKVSVGKQQENVGMSQNKVSAIASSSNEWCIIFDSDNVIGPDYLDAFGSYTGYFEGKMIGFDNYIMCPDFAKPKFDYTNYSKGGRLYDSELAKGLIKQDDFNCLMNTCNYIVNRNFYLNTYEFNKDHIASDTIWHNYNHLKAGGIFAVVPDMQYYHRVHAGSGFMQNADYNIKQANKVRLLIQQL